LNDYAGYIALATDFDETIAERGVVRPCVLAALRRLKHFGTKVVLVTGRELDELLGRFPEAVELDAIVAENGAVLFTPRPPKERALSEPPPPSFAAELRARGVPVREGRIVVATQRPFESVMLDVIRDMGVALDVVFNKGAVMALPSGTNKATGLAAAVAELGLDPRHFVGIGDGENDHPLLAACGLGVAVANAVPALRERAHFVTAGSAGDGFVELVERLASAHTPQKTTAARYDPERP
jgi:hydroxymethylpyrimidine pyrophosphatase-like HAD family hydrolase